MLYRGQLITIEKQANTPPQPIQPTMLKLDRYFNRIPAMDRPQTDTRISTVAESQQWGRTAARIGWGITSLSSEVQRWVEIGGVDVDLHQVAIKSYSNALKRSVKR